MEPVYLWSGLPMFHCNGWTFTWGMAARGGTNTNTLAADIYRAITDHRFTHMCCAPIIFNILLLLGRAESRDLGRPVEVLTGRAPPPAALLEKWRSAWDSLPGDQQARLKARQGISVLSLADVDVKDAGTMASVARDGKTGTEEAFRDGWFLTGDAGVLHPDGYVEIKDRSKDVIISGGENISSVETSEVVVALEEEEILTHCRRNMPHFMVPKKVVFMPELPKTSTGKIQTNKLREMARELNIDFPVFAKSRL
ncbi:Benzoate--CoA ligase, peroxisomal [Platanthera guangdongensis]|uniref:Benzoate--CoA ligase, peroxisomal n=1 Tax=Platanthera guangdongensis TaxID=2320717 RepID=A0ABR2MNW6_9ASPA